MNFTNEPDFVFKIVLIGNSSVGKSSPSSIVFVRINNIYKG